MRRKPLTKLLVLLLWSTTAGCQVESDQGAAEGSGASAVGSDRAEFDVHYAAWEKHRESVSYSSISSDYESGPAYEAIVGMGKRALPLVMEKIAAGNFHMNKAAKRITGVDVAPRGSVDLTKWPPPISSQHVSQRWLAWWEQHRNDPEWRP